MGLFRFGIMAALAGGILLWGTLGKGKANRENGEGGSLSADPSNGARAFPLWSLAAIALLIADLWWMGHGFNPAVDPKLLAFKPPVVTWLQNQQTPDQPWRLTAYATPGDEQLFLANVGMVYGLEDVRGYDSNIPEQYAAYMARYQPQTDLQYNRIAPSYAQVNGQPDPGALDNKLIDLLGVRYVLSTKEITDPAYKLVYNQEVKVYQNARAFPRAFVVPGAVAATDQASALDRLADPVIHISPWSSRGRKARFRRPARLRWPTRTSARPHSRKSTSM